jgi:hypothetical protein
MWVTYISKTVGSKNCRLWVFQNPPLFFQRTASSHGRTTGSFSVSSQEKEPPNIGRFRMHFGKHFMSPSPNPKCNPNAFGNHVKAMEEFFGVGEKKQLSHHILWEKIV